jgi:hypothetical protein
MTFTSENVWQAGNLLVMRRDAQLPDRCIKTNQFANSKRFKATLYWHHPAIYLLILINLLVYVVVAIIVRKKAIVYLGVTEDILQQRRRAITWGWIAGIAGLILFFGALTLQSESAMMVLFILGLLLMLGGLIGGMIKATLVSVERMDDEYIWLRGISKDYLARLPKWNG